MKISKKQIKQLIKEELNSLKEIVDPVQQQQNLTQRVHKLERSAETGYRQDGQIIKMLENYGKIITDLRDKIKKLETALFHLKSDVEIGISAARRRTGWTPD